MRELTNLVWLTAVTEDGNGWTMLSSSAIVDYHHRMVVLQGGREGLFRTFAD